MTINFKNDIKPISYLKTNAAEMMKYVNENRNPIIITQNGEAKAVLMDIDSYQNMQNAFALLNIIKISEDEIKKGDFQDSEEVFTELKNKYFKDQ
ncbi:type II toxin-antitoxin system Phd/YefM family antitoxin [Gracilinema caldarium]|uniref:type II toxin-antitoxin system Phd/YefM family antitoxin n=1 Tax=Gracilinema caldarium TaxID=215591 RepID=UPI0026EFEA12|nr:type II toxin-antitoxin system Phd/YefM family antitoxin [Gracilinema caldarium]